MYWYFLFFLISGFCSVLYEVIWLRLAMAQYGVTTPLVSLVLSTFMLGLGLGSWGAGFAVRKWRARISFPILRLYALTEFLIGISALVVPFELLVGRSLLERMGQEWLSGSGYYWIAGIWIALTLVPWCACMGATFPLAMFAIEETHRGESPRSFSYLYLANVLGAILGTGVPLLLIELVGFRKTLQVTSLCNFFLAATAFALTLTRTTKSAASPERREASVVEAPDKNRLLWLLFGTGLTSMAAEVVWVRMFTAWLSSVVYAFATILAFYLGATYLGSVLYRKRILNRFMQGNFIWAVLGFTVLLPVLANDPRLPFDKFLRLTIGLIPFSAVLGFVTPLMVDRVSGGDGERAGRAYAANIVGCILGPLLAGFVLLPWLGERASLAVLAIPWFAISVLMTRAAVAPEPPVSARPTGRWVGVAVAAAAIAMFSLTSPFEEQFSKRWVRRDYVATVVAKGDERLEKRLLVNGVGMTGLRPVTKTMAHFPLAMLDHPPTNILIICFGMGTTHRSALSWGISSTVVELVPSVPKVYGFFHQDGPALLASPRSHLVIDDGRRFVERTSDLYDVITIDPPPPVEAAGSSLLYSKEFYALLKRHLRTGGIVQQWLFSAEPMVQASVAKALQQSFANVRAFTSLTGNGIHFLASMNPLPPVSAETLASRMPAAAAADFVEWGPEATPQHQFEDLLTKEISVPQIISQSPDVPALEDDRPINEYYYLRHHRPSLLALGASGN